MSLAFRIRYTCMTSTRDSAEIIIFFLVARFSGNWIPANWEYGYGKYNETFTDIRGRETPKCEVRVAIARRVYNL